MTGFGFSSLRVAGAFTAALLLATTPSQLLAQQALGTTFAETVDVDLINVEAWVTDTEDRPVSGLGEDRFRLFHNGAPTEISHFSELREMVPVGSADGALAAEDASGGQPHLIVVFDQLRLTPASQKRMAREIRKYLRKESVSAERVMLLLADTHLEVPHSFGSSRESLDETLASFEDREASTVGLAADLRQVVQSLQAIWEDLNSSTGNTSIRTRVNQVTGPSVSQRAGLLSGSGDTPPPGTQGTAPTRACDDFVGRAGPILSAWGKKELRGIELSLGKLDDVSAFLSGLEGPKTILYVSDGLSLTPGSAATSFVRGLCPAFQTDLEVDALPQEVEAAFLDVTRRLNSNQITLHAILGSGVQEATGSTASQDRQGTRHFQRGHMTAARQALGLISEQTGGRLISSGTGMASELDLIGNEMGTYYSIAFTPPAQTNGTHEIELRTDDPSLRVRHRKSYSDKTPDQWMTERLESALYLGMVSNPLDIRLAAGQAIPLADQVQVPLHIRIPIRKLTFLEVGSRQMARIAIKVMAVQASSRTLVMTDREMFLPRPQEGTGELMDLRVEIQLGSGTQMVAIAVRDQQSSEASFVSTTMEIELPSTPS